MRLPERFFLDHCDRALPTPHVIKWVGRYALVYRDDPSMSELLSDAEHYAHPSGPDDCPSGIIMSAKATVRAIKKAEAETNAEAQAEARAARYARYNTQEQT